MSLTQQDYETYDKMGYLAPWKIDKIEREGQAARDKVFAEGHQKAIQSDQYKKAKAPSTFAPGTYVQAHNPAPDIFTGIAGAAGEAVKPLVTNVVNPLVKPLANVLDEINKVVPVVDAAKFITNPAGQIINQVGKVVGIDQGILNAVSVVTNPVGFLTNQVVGGAIDKSGLDVGSATGLVRNVVTNAATTGISTIGKDDTPSVVYKKPRYDEPVINRAPASTRTLADMEKIDPPIKPDSWDTKVVRTPWTKPFRDVQRAYDTGYKVGTALDKGMEWYSKPKTGTGPSFLPDRGNLQPK
jgi:hypothetical protein